MLCPQDPPAAGRTLGASSLAKTGPTPCSGHLLWALCLGPLAQGPRVLHAGLCLRSLPLWRGQLHAVGHTGGRTRACVLHGVRLLQW